MEEFLAFAIEQTNDGIAIMEFTGDAEVPVRIVFANAAIERLSGYTREELLEASNPFLQIQPQNRVLYEARFIDVRMGKPVRFHVELGGKDRKTWCEIRWSPLRYGGGAVTHYVAVLRDIGDEREAAAQRELLHHAVEDSLDNVAIFDATPPSQGGPRLFYANGSFRHALGYGAEEIVGMSYREFLTEDATSLAEEYVGRAIESVRPIEREMRISRRDGSSFWAEVSAYPVRAEQMKGFWFVVARDITARRRTISDTAIVMQAIDVLPIPVEVYSLEDGEAVSIFRNRVSEAAEEPTRRERLRRALASDAIKPLESEVSVVPLVDASGVADSIIAFVTP